MADILNSQQLTYLDSYIHLFKTEGTYTYRILFLGIGFEKSEHAVEYQIIVTKSTTKIEAGKQYDVSLPWDAAKKVYTPNPDKLTIGVNDFVQWHATTTTKDALPYAIQGLDSKGAVAFDSRALGPEDVFGHFFMEPGDYNVDAGGTLAHLAVADHQKMAPAAYQAMVGATKVMTLTKKAAGLPPGALGFVAAAAPAPVAMVAGQHMYFTVGDGTGHTVSSH